MDKRRPSKYHPRSSKSKKILQEQSSEYSIESDQKSTSQISIEAMEIDVDEQRLQLAKRVIEDAKKSLVNSNDFKRLKDSYLINPSASEDENGPEYSEVGQLTGFLQQKVKETAKKHQFKLYDQIAKEHHVNKSEFKFLTLKAHKRPITACCFNPKTNDVVSVAKDGSIILFDREAGYKRRLLNPGCPKSSLGHSDELLCLDISFDGKYLVTAGKDRSLKVWNLGEYTAELAQMKMEIAKGDFAIMAHGKILPVSHIKRKNSADSIAALSGHSKDQIAKDGESNLEGPAEVVKILAKHPELKLLYSFKGHKEAVNSLKFRLNSYECVSASADRTMKTWDVSQGGMLETFYGHRAEMLEVATLSENNMVSVGFDKIAIVWKLDKETQMIFDEQPFALDCVHAVDPHFFVTGSQSGEICVWNIGKKKPLFRTGEFGCSGWLSSVSGPYNCDFFVIGGREKTVRMFKIEIKGQKISNLNQYIDIPAEGIVSCLKVSDDGKWLAIVESPENRLGRWTVDKKVLSKIRLIKLL